MTLSNEGTLKVCHGTKCLGDGGEDAFELGYGKSVKVGNFKCTSQIAAMRCSVSPSGHGFELSRDALDRLTAAARPRPREHTSRGEERRQLIKTVAELYQQAVAVGDPRPRTTIGRRLIAATCSFPIFTRPRS